MARTKKGSKSPGYEFWSKRPRSGDVACKKNKQACHRIERARAKALVIKEKKKI